VFAGLLVGAMLPFWFSAMTMKSVGKAALAMVEEVRRQFNTINGLMEGTARPDYSRCVEISTNSSLKEMIPPGEPAWRQLFLGAGGTWRGMCSMVCSSGVFLHKARVRLVQKHSLLTASETHIAELCLVRVGRLISFCVLLCPSPCPSHTQVPL
jgi:hypothetical protein